MNQKRIEQLCRDLLREIGEDPDRPGLQDTPRRWAAWWLEFMGYEDNNLDTTFQAVRVDQLVCLSGIRVWSLCEHHLLPFWCNISIAYLSHERIIGISKLARIARKHAQGLNVQEDLVRKIADTVQIKTDSESVAVIAAGEHLCMSMRGIREQAIMHSNEMRGEFRADQALRMELMAMVEHGKT
jgi:GTP cyclohydrolase I